MMPLADLVFVLAVEALAAGIGLFAKERPGRLVLLLVQVAVALDALWRWSLNAHGHGILSVLGPGGFGPVLVAGLGVTIAAYRLTAPMPGDGGRGRYFSAAFAGFMAGAMAVLLLENPIAFWLSIEGTTVFAAILVQMDRGPNALEAAWKVYVIGASGALLAFLGSVLGLAHQDPGVALALIVIGFGTKMGLVPLHTWKPDAYAASPPSLGALLSSVEVLVGFTGIARWWVALGAGASAGGPLIALGFLSVGVGALSLLTQREPKRALAYSTIEQAGLALIALGLGLSGGWVALWIVFNNVLAKPLAFFSLSGRGWSRGLFALAMLALSGAPPFYLFFGELVLLISILHRSALLFVLLLILTLAAFIGVVRLLNAEAFRPRTDSPRPGSLTASLAEVVQGLAVVSLSAVWWGAIPSALPTITALLGGMLK